MPEPTSAPSDEPDEPPKACCTAAVSAGSAFCSDCGQELTYPAGPPGPAAALAGRTPAVAAAAATTAAPSFLGRVLRRALGTTPSGTHRTLTDMDEGELEALARVLEAKRSPLDRWITRGLIPVMLLIAGPLVTYYFTTRADQASEVIQDTNDGIAALADATDALETLVVDAGERIDAADDARAQELHALSVVVQRLENALRIIVLQTAIREAAAVHVARALANQPEAIRPVAAVALLRLKRDKIVRQVQEQTQQQFPDFDGVEGRAEIEAVFDRYVQRQVQAQEEND